jgi:hypothetical protein
LSIAGRVQECTRKLALGDAENAFIQVAIAIDGTAKRLYPGAKTSVRCKQFLKENLPFILWSLTNGTPTKAGSFSFGFSGPGLPDRSTTFESLVYSVMRCSLVHDGELPEKVEFVREPYIGMLNGKMQFPIALVGSLLFAVIASPVNANEKLPESVAVTFGSVTVSVSSLFGSMLKTKEAIRNGFLYDVEALLNEFDAKLDGL